MKGVEEVNSSNSQKTEALFTEQVVKSDHSFCTAVKSLPMYY